ncbi:MAG: 16S rRNA (adenine(1518)-N(6)/adenine(1519)-N(6))-dimethyltransferase RsmA [Chloroflexi bacterium]|nr:16S rRNA (adenine(1518)-N(6)/adenine(1519)-N(6))-dimethyltransferase RsmA [Chloroflexota bacterium]
MDIRELLAQWDIEPNRALGQNFLSDAGILERIVAAADLSHSDVVLEIGPGLGTLTERLARDAGRVVAVELDHHMSGVLQERLRRFSNLDLIEGDILSIDPGRIIQSVWEQHPQLPRRYKVVANLPYYITSAAIRQLLEASPQPTRLIVTVQREVAERITASPGDMSVLAVSVQFYGRPTVLFRIKAGSFHPAPAVESAVVRIDSHPAPIVQVPDRETFFRVVKAGFSQRRKQLRNTLSAGLRRPREDVGAMLSELGIDPRRRAETLTIAEWGAIASAVGHCT